MLKKLLILMMIALSSMHLFDVQANTNALSQLPEAIQQRLYERLNNQEDDAITETKLTASDGASNDYFGQEIFIDGTTLVVSSRYDDDNGSDSGSVYVYDLTKNSGDTGFERKIISSDGVASDHFGRSVALDGTTLVVSAHFDDDNGAQSGSVYVYDLTKNSGDAGFERKITASDGATKDYFGHQIALDESTLVVSSHQDDDNGEGSGSVYVYDLTKTNADAGFETKITASDGVASDNFGFSIEIQGTTIVVGAPKGDFSEKTDVGSVYVYDLTKNNGDAGFERKISASDAEVDARFGNSVAIDGTTLVVGSRLDDHNGTETGSVYVYDLTKNNGDAGFENKITASDGASNDNFGYSVALYGSTLVVGANLDDDKGTNSGSVYVYDLTKNSGDDGFETKITASDGATDDNFGVFVAFDGSTLFVGARLDDDNGSGSGSVYIYNGTFGSGNTDTEDPITETKLTASDGALNDYFGESIAIDGTTLVVGASREGGNGAVYVYDLTKDSNEVGFERKITASDGASNDIFGKSVAINGTTLVVGSDSDDDNAVNSGSVYVYDLTKTPEDDGFETKITASDGAIYDYFGYTVSIQNTTVVVGTYNADTVYVYDLNKSSSDEGFETKITSSTGGNDKFGYSVDLEGTTLVVGSSWDDDKGLDSGSVYVYDLTKTSEDDGFERKITASDGSSSDYFGSSVAIDSTTLIVGSSWDDNEKGSNSGSVYVYDLTKTPEDDGFETKITASDGTSNDYFGYSVAIDGDTLLVTSYGDDDKGTNSGSVYVYDLTKNSGDDEFETKITASDGASDDNFGFSGALNGTTLVVGAYKDDDKGTNSGSVYIYNGIFGSGTTDTETQITENKITASDGVTEDYFAQSVAIDGNTLVVGAYLDDDNGSNSGSVYVYDLTKTSGDDGFETKITASDGAAGDYFGWSVAIDGTTLVVGAYGDADNGSNSGSVYVYDLTKTSLDAGFERKITASDNATSDLFGRSVAIDGTTLVVGAYGDDDNGTDSGSVYVYDLTKTSLDAGFERKITASDGVASDNFGFSIEIQGTTIVVGATKGDSSEKTDVGSVYVYNLTKTSADTGFERKITASDGVINDFFGYSVKINGLTLVVGAYGDDDNGTDSGSVYVYDLTKTPEDDGFETKITTSDGANLDFVGTSNAIDGATLVVGAHTDDDNGSTSGSVYVYDLTKTPEDDGFETKITASDGASGDFFGWSVAIDGTKLVIGAYGDDDKGERSGSVYIYNGTFGSGKTKTDEEWASEMTTMIDALSEPYVRADVEAARTAYDALTEAQQALVANYQTLLDAEQALADIDAAAAVNALIDALSEPYVRADVEAARTAYDALIEAQQALVANYQTLLDAEQALADIDAAAVVDALIDALSEPYDPEAVQAARDAYDALTPEQQALVTNYQTLLNAEQALADQDAAAAVDSMIDALTDPYDIDAIEAARDAYENLTEAQKALVTGLLDLEEAEQRYADMDAASIVDGMIAALSEPYDAVAVYDSRQAYDALTETQKGYVTRLPELEAAEQALADINAAAAVDALIDALTSPYVQADVEAARAFYDTLTTEQQALVTNYQALLDAEQALADINAAAAVDALIDVLSEPYDPEAVQDAREAYENLTNEQQILVTGLLDLETAEDTLMNETEAAGVDALIQTLTQESTEEEVDAVRKAYESLTEEQQALVTQLPTLVIYEQQFASPDSTGLVFFMIFFIGVISAVIYFAFYKRNKEKDEKKINE